MNRTLRTIASLIAIVGMGFIFVGNPALFWGITVIASGFCLIALFVALYFLPTLIGRKRQISSYGPLWVVNLFTGWTVVGWFACILWSAVATTQAQDDFYRQQMQK